MSDGGVHLTREDVVFGRALLAFGLASREAIEACAAEYRALLAKGEKTTLAKVALAKELLTAEQYQKLAQEMRKRFAGSSNEETREAAEELPDITRTGSYTRPAAPTTGKVSKTQVQRAAAAFEESAKDLIEDGSKMEVKAPPPPPAAPLTKRVTKPEAKPAPAAEAAPSQQDWKKQLGATDRHASDAAIRKKLKVPADADAFDFGEYQGLEFIGAGAVGVSYKAKAADGHPVLLKAFSGAGSQDKSLRRFLQERRVFQSLDHPAMVKVHDVGIQDDIPYFASDFVEGRTLADVLKNDRPARDVLIAIVARLAEAVGYVHDKGIVLRDLKPESVIIRSSDGHPIIVELGLAKDLGSDLKLTVSGSIAMTPSFAAPEVQKDPAAATVASDVYTLGVLLYEATCGKLPFEAKNAVDLLVKIMSESPPPPSKVDAASPHGLDDVCLKALSREPAQRHTTARAFAFDLDGALKSGGANDSSQTGLFSRLKTKLFKKKT
jgi:hypothetical protein